MEPAHPPCSGNVSLSCRSKYRKWSSVPLHLVSVIPAHALLPWRNILADTREDRSSDVLCLSKLSQCALDGLGSYCAVEGSFDNAHVPSAAECRPQCCVVWVVVTQALRVRLTYGVRWCREERRLPPSTITYRLPVDYHLVTNIGR